jgi:uncharacterized protein (TIGR02246 family)
VSAGPDLEKRIRQLEDVQAIERLFQDYRKALDGREPAAYARLYTEDGIYSTRGGRFAQGRDAIEALVVGLVGTEIARESGEDFHVYANPVIAVEGDRATCELTWAFVQRGDDGLPQITKLGRYDAVVVRVDGEWKFERRDSTLLIGAPE